MDHLYLLPGCLKEPYSISVNDMKISNAVSVAGLWLRTELCIKVILQIIDSFLYKIGCFSVAGEMDVTRS